MINMYNRDTLIFPSVVQIIWIKETQVSMWQTLGLNGNLSSFFTVCASNDAVIITLDTLQPEKQIGESFLTGDEFKGEMAFLLCITFPLSEWVTCQIIFIIV
jgi:hypothetical protein